jgi:hypothetical protein
MLRQQCGDTQSDISRAGHGNVKLFHYDVLL